MRFFPKEEIKVRLPESFTKESNENILPSTVPLSQPILVTYSLNLQKEITYFCEGISVVRRNLFYDIVNISYHVKIH